MLNHTKIIITIALLAIFTINLSICAQENPTPPVAKIQPDTIKIHDVTLIDNYRWIKDMKKDNQEAIDYVKAENEYTDAMMKHTEKMQENLFQEMKSRIKETDLNVPVKIDNYYYYTRTEEGQQYSIFCRKKDSLENEEEVTLDINKMAEGYEFFNVGMIDYSPNHRFVAYTVDTTGAEKYTLFFKDLEKNKILPDQVFPTYGGEWAADNNTFFYVRDESIDTESPSLAYYHILGTKQEDDVLIYKEENLAYGIGGYTTRSKEYLMMSIGDGNSNEVRYIKADAPFSEFKLIAPLEEGVTYYPHHHEDKFYLLVKDKKSPNKKVMVAPADNPSKENWTEFIAHRDSVYISGFDVFKNYMVLHERKKGLEKMRIIDMNTQEEHYVDFPEPVYTFYSTRNPNFDTEEYRFNYYSLVTPRSVFDYNLKTRKMELKKQTEVIGGYDKEQYQSERIWATADDGTQVPISLVYKKELFKKDGTNPLYLYSYGSYGNSSDPYFSSLRLTLLDRGFVYAIAHIRGGSELGEEWYEQGKMLNKKNTFTDFIDCAEHLIAEKYTTSDKLVINGGSAGGMLMGVVANWRPDLFKVVLANVPAVNNLNTMMDATIPGVKFHYSEWGNPNIKKEFDYLLSWDPYYQIKAQDYPHILVTSGLNDPRVLYWEPTKWVAKLRATKTDDNLLLLKTNMTGHMGASGRFDWLKEIAFEYALTFDILGIE